MNTETNPAGTMARLQAAEAELQRLRGQEPVDRCYSSDDGDIWFDADCDINLLESINPAVCDVVELLVSVIGWREKFKVVAAPDDDGNGEYEVEPLSPRNLYPAPVPPPDVRELVELVQQFESQAWDGCTLRRRDDPLCQRARAALAKFRRES
ncbi:hypothetical protein JN531_012075 [Flagellatimonas centrodinii]|uniref:hypothetical protein n=1 Tax=Flagellatimonas centrodinii TaxID=2806210 RepID=UPI001FF000CB|nr:hypothetical protein [Flagellatimonas centrodinii]ULQ45837.1 hypothetical protein JN531_012075 [Flagellatimonas centrodinii]